MSTAEEAFPWLFTNAANAEVVAEVVDYGIPTMREAEGDTLEYVTAEEAMQRLRVGPEQFRKNYVAVLDRVDLMGSGVEVSSPRWAPPGEQKPDTGAGYKQAQLHLRASTDYAYQFDFEVVEDLAGYRAPENERVYPHKKTRAENIYLEGSLDDWDGVPRATSDENQPLDRRHGWLQAKRQVVSPEDMVGCETGSEVWETGFDPGLEPSRRKSSEELFPWESEDLYAWEALQQIHIVYRRRQEGTRWNHEGMPRKGGRFTKRT